MEKNQLFKKPNQAILITNGDITATQRKAYNGILYKAYNLLKDDPNLNLFEFTVSEIKKLAGIKGNDNWHTKKDLEALKKVEVDIVRDKKNWDMFNLIAWVGRKDDKVVIQLPEPVRRELIDCNFYTTLNQLILKTLTGKYAIILYEIAIRYHKVQIPEMTLEELRELTGTQNKKSYHNFAKFNQAVLTPAIDEINEKTDIEVAYELKRQGIKVISVKFNIKKNKNDNVTEISCNDYCSDQILELASFFKSTTGFNIDLNLLKGLVNEYGVDKIYKYIYNYSKFSFSKDKNIDFKTNSFMKAIRETWEIPVFKSKIPHNMDFDQRTYTETEYEQFYSNTKKADQ